MATTTPNYGWPVPTSTDYVKDGATAIEALGDAVDATLGGFFNIKQIVQGSTQTAATSSTSTYADTGLTATITPTSASNKIIVLYYHGSIFKTAANSQSQMQFQVLRNATNIGLAFALYTNSAMDLFTTGPSGMIFDAPATTAATTYKTQFANTANVAQVGINNSTSHARIILIEVEA
jgi:hypothetical protein